MVEGSGCTNVGDLFCLFRRRVGTGPDLQALGIQSCALCHALPSEKGVVSLPDGRFGLCFV